MKIPHENQPTGLARHVLAIACLSAAFGLVGCEQQKDTTERAEEKVERAAETAEQKIDQAKDQAQQEIGAAKESAGRGGGRRCGDYRQDKVGDANGPLAQRLEH